MEIWTSTLFSGLFMILGIGAVPAQPSSVWQVVDTWKKNPDGYKMTVGSSEIISECKKSPDAVIVFPQVVHSYHEFFIDGVQIATHGDRNFSKASPFYEKPVLKCEQISHGKKLEWSVVTYSSFFARVREWPEVKSNLHASNVINISMNIAAFGILLTLSVFSLLIYRGRVSNTLTYSLSFGSLFLSGYFLNASNSYMGITYSMLTSHKLADGCLWVGALLFINAFSSENFLGRINNLIFFCFCVVGVVFIALGSNGDAVQFGTTIPMLSFFYCSILIIKNLIKKIAVEGLNMTQSLKVISILLFTGLGLNDVLNVTGVIHSEMLLSIGSIGGCLGLSIAVSQAIEKTYDERDHLLVTLEEKVLDKTKHLEQALKTLQTTQAELVQSARLASLGTLSAGIAHEINNSINYVNGAVVPLERKIRTLIPSSERAVVDKLLESIREGTHLTVEIVKSLRSFTGLNQAALKDVYIKEVAASVLTILKSKLKNVNVKLDIQDSCCVSGNIVGLNQIFMNLMTNSLDALNKENKEIKISAKENNSGILIEFEDNGSGIPKDVMSRIFDPFFTTKEVGHGTGLGLHIVKKEIERHKGKIEVFSEEGKGTKFTIQLPKNAVEDFGRAA
jgi:signal transduction histidine kinase